MSWIKIKSACFIFKAKPRDRAESVESQGAAATVLAQVHALVGPTKLDCCDIANFAVADVVARKPSSGESLTLIHLLTVMSELVSCCICGKRASKKTGLVDFNLTP
jgi:hypothetical protein